MRKAIFFDRDGIINKPPPQGEYILSWEDFIFNDSIIKLLNHYKANNWLLFLITNQQCVGKQLISQTQLEEIHNNMQNHLSKFNAQFDKISVCTHLTGTCTCKKPSPQMINILIDEHSLSKDFCWMIGDQDSDILAGKNAEIKTIRFVCQKKHISEDPDHLIYKLSELYSIID